ncbi:MAG TPA: S-layer homology domain-containing protein, partial [Thermoanaerobaculaceae bacterium]|nr:S-layer homology domain-containing protein [Thermoanaerobaculaceae bacterium]
TGGGTGVTVSGTGFQPYATVTIGGVNATSVSVVNATTITATTGAHAAGSVSVVVQNPDAQSATKTNAYTYGAASSFSPAALKVDESSGGGVVSNLNGILDPGETVMVTPSWTNQDSAGHATSGALDLFTGPAGASYTLLDAAAGYGTVGAGATANCHDATGDCYLLSVSNPASRPAAHWDASVRETLSTGEIKVWTLHVGGSFTDVPVSDFAYPYVERLLHNGVTAGCGGSLYCPSDTVTRWQMGIFLAKAIVGASGSIPVSGTVNGQAFNCVSGGASLFGDVPPTDFACPHVHLLYAQGVTSGCGGGNYCPSTLVNRWQMGIFLAKAIVGASGSVPTSGTVNGQAFNCVSGGTSLFADVPPTDFACPYVHLLYSQGVTAGCGGGDYCPSVSVTRWQMSIFLGKSFTLPLY